jgi:hypothetical protein
MATQKFLFIYRNLATNARTAPPSPEEMQQMYSAWNGWKDKFKANVLDIGDGLKPGGKVLTTTSITDGPYAEAKEIIGGYSIVSADSYDQALAVAKECPIMRMPSARIEIRELMGFDQR